MLQNSTFDSYILKIYILAVVVVIQIYMIIDAGDNVYEDVSKNRRH